jgi:hypothetical protein
MPPAPNRSDFPTPYLQLGAKFDSIFNPVDGRRYSSRRQYEAEVHAHGCTVTAGESVKPPSREPRTADVVGDIKKSIEQLSSLSDSERSNMMSSQEVATSDEMAAAGV